MDGLDRYSLVFSCDIVHVLIIRFVDRLHNSGEQSCLFQFAVLRRTFGTLLAD